MFRESRAVLLRQPRTRRLRAAAGRLREAQLQKSSPFPVRSTCVRVCYLSLKYSTSGEFRQERKSTAAEFKNTRRRCCGLVISLLSIYKTYVFLILLLFCKPSPKLLEIRKFEITCKFFWNVKKHLWYFNYINKRTNPCSFGNFNKGYCWYIK